MRPSARLRHARHGLAALALLAVAALGGAARAETVYIESNGNANPMAILTTTSFWTTEPVWIPVNGLNDADDGASKPEFDFVGSVTSPGFYWAKDNDYVYMRMRVDVDTIDPANFSSAPTATFFGSIWAYINVSGGNIPDYAIVWDSKAAVKLHGLEMQRYSLGTNWDDLKMDDLDGEANTRGEEDINGLISETTTYMENEGYIRVTDGQAMTGTGLDGTSTLIDFAVSLSYLEAHTTLTQSQSWYVQLGSTDQSTDHGVITIDVAGNVPLGDNQTHNPIDASDFRLVPEPSMALLALAACGLLAGRRSPRRRRAA